MVLIQREGEWVEASLTSYTNELELQKILRGSPELIPGCIGVAIVDEMPIRGGRKADLVAVNELGEVWLVECKLQTNQEARHAVIGQILAYAGGLWRLGYEEFDQQFSARAGRPMLDAMADNAATDFDPEKCKKGLEETLQLGRFRLVIAVDQITDELKRIIEYVNGTTASQFSPTALELGYLREGDLQILVPNLYGPGPSRRPEPAQRWTLEAVEEAVASLGTPAREVITELMAHARRAGAVFKGGVSADHRAATTTALKARPGHSGHSGLRKMPS